MGEITILFFNMMLFTWNNENNGDAISFIF